MFEQDVDDLPELFGVLAHVGVLDLEDVDAVEEDGAMDGPAEVVVGELADGVGGEGAEAFGAAFEADEVFGGGAEFGEGVVSGALPLFIEEDDEVDGDVFDEFGEGLRHEDRAAVDGGEDGIGRKEEGTGPGGGGVELFKAIEEIAGQRAKEGFGVGDGGEVVGASAGADGLGQLEKSAAEGAEVGPFEGVADDEAEQRAGPGVGEVGGEAAAFVDVFPAEEQEVLLENGLDVAGGKLFADGAAVFVEHTAGGLIEHLPATFPGHHAEVGIFEIEGLEEFVKAAECEELAAVEGAGAAAAVEAGEEAVDALIDAVADAEAAVFPPRLGEACLFAHLLGIAEENLAGDGEDLFVGEAGEEGGEEVRLDAHVAVEQDDDIVAGGAEAGVGAAAEAEVGGVADEADTGKLDGNEVG